MPVKLIKILLYSRSRQRINKIYCHQVNFSSYESKNRIENPEFLSEFHKNRILFLRIALIIECVIIGQKCVIVSDSK